MPSVLFVCTANRFRSPLAEGFFEQALAKEENERSCSWPIGKAADWVVSSAGIRAVPLQPVLPDVLEAGKLLGIDLSGHLSQRVQDLELADFDLILVMQENQKQVLLNSYPDHRERIYLLSQVLENDAYDFPDHFRSLHGVRGVGGVLSELIHEHMCNICVLAIALHNKRSGAVHDAQIDPGANSIAGPSG
jgi:protein-tyrosine-phosphatase